MAKLNSVVDANIDESIKGVEKELKGTVNVSRKDLQGIQPMEETIIQGKGRIADLEIDLKKVIRRYY